MNRGVSAGHFEQDSDWESQKGFSGGQFDDDTLVGYQASNEHEPTDKGRNQRGERLFRSTELLPCELAEEAEKNEKGGADVGELFHGVSGKSLLQSHTICNRYEDDLFLR